MEITLEEWAAEWFRVHTDGKLIPNTVGGYRNLIFNHIVPRLGGAALTDLSEKRIRSFYRKLSRAGLNGRSVWCVHLLLRRILEEACREGLIPENLAWGISVEHGETPEASGLRQGELISLPWVAVDVCGRRVVLKKRWVGLSARTTELMTEEHARYPNSPEVFLDTKTGQPYAPHQLYYLHRKILNEARLPVIGFRQLQLSARGLGL